jgi:hypothetical protein
VTLSWTQVSGPTTVTFANPSAAVTAATAPVVGTYVLRLSANDGELVASDDVTVRVGDATSLPDLSVGSIDTSGLQVDDRTFALSGVVTALVANPGLAAAAGPFTLTFFEDHDGNAVFDPLADGLLGSIDLASLGTGATQPVSVPLSGTLLFRGNLVHAFVDSASVVVESDETNNYGSSTPPCPEPPPSGEPFQPVWEWIWNGSGSPVPTANKIETAPVVIDLDLDGVPEILTNTWSSSVSYLRALSGRDGHHVFTLEDTPRRLYWASHIAVGNLDADPNPAETAQPKSSSDGRS